MPFLTPDNQWSEPLTCRTIRFPASDDWRSIVDGLLSELIVPSAFEQSGGISPEDTAAAFDAMFWDYFESECLVADYPKSAFIPGSLGKRTFGSGGITTEYSSLYMLGQRSLVSTPAVGSKWEYSFLLASGRYEMRHVIQRVNSSNGCVVDWYLDDELVIDNMSFLGSAANVQINTTVNVLTQGVHTLRGEVVSITGIAQPPVIHYIQFVDSLQTG